MVAHLHESDSPVAVPHNWPISDQHQDSSSVSSVPASYYTINPCLSWRVPSYALSLGVPQYCSSADIRQDSCPVCSASTSFWTTVQGPIVCRRALGRTASAACKTPLQAALLQQTSARSPRLHSHRRLPTGGHLPVRRCRCPLPPQAERSTNNRNGPLPLEICRPGTSGSVPTHCSTAQASVVLPGTMKGRVSVGSWRSMARESASAVPPWFIRMRGHTRLPYAGSVYPP